jgi:hypothetical protein
MRKGFIEVSLLTIGICLSLITNLFTSDDSVLNFYNEYKTAIIVAGGCLIMLSIILAYNSANNSDHNKSSILMCTPIVDNL